MDGNGLKTSTKTRKFDHFFDLDTSLPNYTGKCDNY